MPGFELIGQEEKAALAALIDNSGILAAHGFNDKRNGVFEVRSLEREFAARMQTPYATAVSSGTAALKVALKALGVGAGDEVITQAFNFIATVEAILDCGATPIVTTIDESLNMDPLDLRRRIGPRTKAIIVVHMLGAVANLSDVLAIAREHGIPVIEDACEAPGALWDGRPVGTLAELGVFSFDMGKLMTAGEGGMIVTSDERLHRFCKEYHDHGHENNPTLPRGRDSRTIYGFNYRMTELQACVARVQLRRLDHMLAENWRRHDALHARLGRYGRTLFARSRPNAEIFIFRPPTAQIKAAALEVLREHQIGTKNLPDAIEWHCAAFWDHAVSAGEVAHSKSTQHHLESCLSIPIWLRRPVEDYELLANRLANLCE